MIRQRPRALLASTTVANSTSIPSPVVLTIRPRCTAILGSISLRRYALRRARVPFSSAPIRREQPATSEARIAASRRSTRACLRASWRLPVARNPMRTHARCPLRLKPSDRRHLRVKIQAYLCGRGWKALVRVPPPVPGYFPDMAIFPGFPDRKFPVISPAMSGLGASKYLIRQRYLQQTPRFAGPIRVFRGNFPVRSGICSPAMLPGDTSSVPPGCRR